MKKYYAFSLIMLICFSGCLQRKRKQTERKPVERNELAKEVNIPVADDNIKSFFDEEVGEFALADEVDQEDLAADNFDSKHYAFDSVALDDHNDDFAWIEEPNHEDKQFKAIYFNFGKYTIRDDQEENIAYNIALVKEIIQEDKESGRTPTVVIDGHACHSAGSAVYNLALSEKRAKIIADRCVAAGIPKEYIKIVGRGYEVPAVVEGKQIDGDRAQQWPNRRDEMHIIHA